VTLFVDSSGILSLVDREDPAHAGVIGAFALGRSEPLSTHAYVIVETLAVARRRHGPAIAADLIDRVIPALDGAPVDAALHVASVAALQDTVGSSVTLMDRTSFAFMRREGIERAIALDADFRTAGFET
jgi:uncharacterized protein